MDHGDRPNVFVLSADSLRADAFRALMDEIPDLIGGVTFTNAVSTANATGSSMPSLVGGVYSETVHAATRTLKFGASSAEDGITTTAEALSEAGYDCRLWSSNHIVGAERHYDRGFENDDAGAPSYKKRAQFLVQRLGSERLFDAARWGYFNVLNPLEDRFLSDDTYYEDARSFHRDVLSSLGDERAGGQMRWIHYMDTHHPFDPPAEYLEKRDLNTERSRSRLAELSSRAIITNRGAGISDEDVEDIEQAYLAACEHWRDELAMFMTLLKRRGHFVPGRDVMIVTSDHGEGFDRESQGMIGHTPTPAFWEDLVRVPLLVSNPDWEPGTVDRQVSHIDVMPTILDAVGVDVPDSMEGRVAAEPADMGRERVFFSSVGPERVYRGICAENGWKLFSDRIRDVDVNHFTHADGDGHDHVRVLLTHYDADSETVRFEREIDEGTVPDSDPHREIYESLLAELTDRRGALVTNRDDEGVPEDVEQQLRDLGYVDDLPQQ